MARWRKRRTVLFLLLVSVLAPIVLYTDRLANFSTSILNSDFIDDGSNLSFTNEVGKVNALHQESSDAVKEPIWIVHPDSISISDQISDHSAGTAALQAEELPLESSGEHKSRVLSAAYNGTQSESDHVVEQVVGQAGDKQVLEKPKDGEENKETASQKIGDEEPTNSVLSMTNDEVQSENKGMIEQVVSQGTNGMEKADIGEKNKDAVLQKIEDPTVSLKQEINNEKSPEPMSNRVRIRRRKKKPANKLNIGSTTSPDAMVRHLKNQLLRANVYLGLGSTRRNPNFIRDLHARIRDVQRALGDSTEDSALPKNAYAKLKAMEQTLSLGKKIEENCSVDMEKLHATLATTEEQLDLNKKQTLYLMQLAAKALPKGLHCLPLRLTTEYYTSDSSKQQFPHQEKLEDPKLYHYALFSDNILAAAVVVNSTVFHAKNPENHVFHIVTDRLNYAAMRMWFLASPPGKAAIQVQNIEGFAWLNSSYSPVLKQLESQSMIDYYFRAHQAKPDENSKFRNPKYLSILNHLRFYLPEIFPKLNKVLFLDDDIVVQRDLTALWSIDFKGKVNGAVETCRQSFHRFDRYLNFSNPLISKNFDPNACGWAYGMNIFDLVEWKKQKLTDAYHSWQQLNEGRLLWKLGTLPAGLVTFWNRTLPLDRSWHVLGLGYDPNVSQKSIERAAVIHYNGNLKPWLEIGLPKYRNYWSKFVDFDQVFLRECNINP
ncbi:probable galacturonosyltransferase 4 isoform X1 [Typha latifolia]|uniref:probable galacturonosyltransferase 4 isoform X1 n=1 Tax=Typha latifolia TaxID=4733 RepID=UPI003C2AEEA6